MNSAKATLSNFRQSPRKMRLVANLVRGKKVTDALLNLEFTTKKASLPIRNLLTSAIANAKSLGMETEKMIVKSITVDGGRTLKRRQPAARGSAHPINKRTSHIFVEVAEVEGKQKKMKISKEKLSPTKVETKEDKKTKKNSKSKTTKK